MKVGPNNRTLYLIQSYTIPGRYTVPGIDVETGFNFKVPILLEPM